MSVGHACDRRRRPLILTGWKLSCACSGVDAETSWCFRIVGVLADCLGAVARGLVDVVWWIVVVVLEVGGLFGLATGIGGFSRDG